MSVLPRSHYPVRKGQPIAWSFAFPHLENNRPVDQDCGVISSAGCTLSFLQVSCSVCTGDALVTHPVLVAITEVPDDGTPEHRPRYTPQFHLPNPGDPPVDFFQPATSLLAHGYVSQSSSVIKASRPYSLSPGGHLFVSCIPLTALPAATHCLCVVSCNVSYL
jgi:hypothetical protein